MTVSVSKKSTCTICYMKQLSVQKVFTQRIILPEIWFSQRTLRFYYNFRYATAYTMMPVFSLVLDVDVTAEIAMTYPELYKELTKVLSFTVLVIL